MALPDGYKKVSVYVDVQVYEALRKAAYESHMAQSELIRSCLIDWLQQHGYKVGTDMDFFNELEKNDDQ